MREKSPIYDKGDTGVQWVKNGLQVKYCEVI